MRTQDIWRSLKVEEKTLDGFEIKVITVSLPLNHVVLLDLHPSAAIDIKKYSVKDLGRRLMNDLYGDIENKIRDRLYTIRIDQAGSEEYWFLQGLLKQIQNFEEEEHH
jgi:hypothetical protein